MKNIHIWLWVVLTLVMGCRKSDVTNEKRDGVESERIKNSSVQAEKEKKNEAGKMSPPNVIVLLLDTLRPDYLGFYGASKEPAPFLSSLAEKSAVFENAMSTSSWTAPATASLFTSLYPPQHTVIQGFRAHRALVEKVDEDGTATLNVNHIPSKVTTLPEMFKAAGYRTFGYSANINIGDAIGFSRGFDRFEKKERATAEEAYEKVMKWREDIVGKTPFFLYLHLNDAHVPYHRRTPYFQPAKDRKGDPAARYLSEISHLDSYLKKIWALPGIAENSVLVVLSDHGEEFWDHGSTEHGPTLYSELQYIVFMLHGQSHGILPKRVRENVSLIDVMPTLAELIGANVAHHPEGLSLMSVLTGEEDAVADKINRLRDRCLFAHRVYSSYRKLALWSITRRRMKLIDWWGDRQKLFDHQNDRGEYHDLKREKSKTADEMYRRLAKFKQRMEKGQSATEKEEIALDEALLSRLKKLGYVE